MKRNCKAPDYYGLESSVCSATDQESVPATKRPKLTNHDIETVIQEEPRQTPLIESSFHLPIASHPDPRIRHIGTTLPEKYNYAGYEREVSMSVFDAENQI